MSPTERWAQIEAVARGILRQFTSPGVSIFWGYLASAAVLAVLVHALRHRSLRGLLSYLVPRQVWWHRSVLHDFALFVINTLLYSFLLLAPLSWISTGLGQRTWLALHQGFGSIATPLTGPAAMLGLSVVAFVIADLSFFLAHFALHRIPVLWEFHKVHHSAPVLQPLTVLRRHPADIVFDGVVSGALLGPLYGVVGWVSGGQLEPLTILGVNAVLFVALTAGFNLQHSHVWLSFGPLDRWLISPATHQLHHSVDPAHHDRNFGNFLAIWDRLTGSLLTPREVAGASRDPALRFGLGEAGGVWEREYGSLWRLYLWPFWRVALNLFARTRTRARAR
jgi:sterol desaturase/sphingolipid hydroxylase (fatty acid hydroxylase superfamily)